MGKKRAFTAEEVAVASRLYADLVPTREIGRQLGMAHKTVNSLLLSAGVQLRTRGQHRRIDATGHRYGRLTAISDTGVRRHNSSIWLWLCDCGNTTEVPLNAVRQGNTTSCGCYRLQQLNKACANDLTGQTFGRLTAIKPIRNSLKTNGAKGSLVWQFRCTCGNLHQAEGRLVKSGHIQSCGCLRSERISQTKRVDITGQRHARLVALNRVPGSLKWTFQCDCGNTIDRLPYGVTSGNTASCGCLKREQAAERARVDAAGQRFGLLTAIEPVGQTRHGKFIWRFACDCGGSHQCVLSDALSGRTRSCGCLAAGEDSIESWLDGTFRAANDPSEFYVFTLANYPEHLKPGITRDVTERQDQEYGDQLLSIQMQRIDTWLLEQAVLYETRLLKNCPLALSVRCWHGRTELRRIDPDALISIATDLHNQLLDLGRYEFALRFVPMTAEQAQQIKLRLQSAA
jgi:hypothetical protein